MMAVATALAAAAAPVVGAEFNPLGDGSDFNNGDLLRDETTGCENCQPQPHEWDEPPFELDWQLGYPFALLLMVVSALVPMWYFRKRGWLK